MGDDNNIAQLISAATSRWGSVPDALRSELTELFSAALSTATAAEQETLLVTNPTSRPQRLQLAVIATDRKLDSMYHQEWCELSVSQRGALFLVYRRRDGQHYASRYDEGVTLPETLIAQLPPALAEALLDA
ncbi:MAG: hypothetical protein PF961_09925 [Planctomycetota bacterium]|nr:hypothetical protein [Planctomycetota bacterium]